MRGLDPVMAVSAWDVSVPVGVAVLACAVGAWLVMAWLWRSTAPSRVAPGPASMELGDEPPAVVDLLTGGFRVEADAVPATVVDLAARKHLDIEELGGHVRLRLRQHTAPGDDQLTAYERRVLAHVRDKAVEGYVPAEVLTLGARGVSERWFTSFVREVNGDAQRRGLCRRRFDLTHVVVAWVVVLVGAGPAALVAQGGDRTLDPTGWGSVGNVLLGLALLAGAGLVWVAMRVTASNAQRDTPSGREAATRWLGVREHMRTIGDFADKPAASVAIWDRHLAYATAMGLAPEVQRQLPFETEHDRLAWSRVTGTWRRVRVRYRSFVPGWGQHPGRVAFQGLVQGVVLGALSYGGFVLASTDLDVEALTDDQRRWIGLAGLVVCVVAAAAALLAAAKVVIGLSDLFARRTVEGELIRARERREWDRLPQVVQWAMFTRRDQHGIRREEHRRRQWYLAVDSGESDTVQAYAVRQQIYQQVRQGARVRLLVTPRLGYVRSAEMLSPPPGQTAPTVPHDLVGDAVRRAGAALPPQVQGVIGAVISGAQDLGQPSGGTPPTGSPPSPPPG